MIGSIIKRMLCHKKALYFVYPESAGASNDRHTDNPRYREVTFLASFPFTMISEWNWRMEQMKVNIVKYEIFLTFIT